MILKLQYPVKIFGVTFAISREIGFLFTNLQMFNFRENTGVTNSKQMKEWIEKNGNSEFASEMLFAAAQAYCMMEKTKQNFTKEKLEIAINLSSKETKERLTREWDKSIDKPTEADKKKVTVK